MKKLLRSPVYHGHVHNHCWSQQNRYTRSAMVCLSFRACQGQVAADPDRDLSHAWNAYSSLLNCL